MAEKLDPRSLREWLDERPAWTVVKDRLVRVFQFSSFRDSVVFVNRVATLADAHDHHPDIYVRYDAVRLSLWTHTVGGVTEKDIELAEQIDFATSHQ